MLTQRYMARYMTYSGLVSGTKENLQRRQFVQPRRLGNGLAEFHAPQFGLRRRRSDKGEFFYKSDK
jgi:hypothetical protein